MNSKGFNFSISDTTDGTDQGQREPVAFRQDYFNVDEMSFEVLLSMASEYAASFNYYNSANQKEGSWAELFNANEAVIMALIATTDVERIESDFSRLDFSDLRIPANTVIGVAAMLDFWLQQLTAATSESAVELRNNIHGVIKSKLLPGLHTAAVIADHAAPERNATSGAAISGLSSVWSVVVETGETSFPLALKMSFDDVTGVMSQLEMALLKMTGAIRYLKTLVGGMLEHSLQGQSHEPAVGLFMVFLHLYKVAQQRLNRFTLRHLKFYYRDCLKSAPRGREAESLFLKFEAAATTSPFIIDRNVAFSAEKKLTRNSHRYYLKTSLLVCQATVSDLRTLYLQRNLLVSPECELGHVTRIKANQRSLSIADDAHPMPLFGAAKNGMKLSKITDANIGFCVASSMLALKEGRREVTLLIDFALPDGDTIEQLFGDAVIITSSAEFTLWFGKVFSYYLLNGEAFLNTDRRSRIEMLIARFDADGVYTVLMQQSWQALFYKLFSKPFAITLSGESGWLPVKEYLVSPTADSGLKIVFSLAHNIEPIVAYDAELHGEARACSLPMMNVCLDPEASFFSYSLLNSLAVNRVEIEVSASDVKELVVANQLGRIDPAKPFAIFGPIPSRNSYLIIGNREAATKPVIAMKLALVWGDLPTQAGGFSSYYDGYDFVPHNSNFKADISVLHDGSWAPGKADAQYRVMLFNSGDEGVVCEHSELDVGAADYFKPLDASERVETFEYRGIARNGFVRLQMQLPENGFGHADYPLLLTRVLTENSRRKKPRPVPNTPYTPVVSQLSISYTARSLIRLQDDSTTGSREDTDRLFHLHPFGIDQLYPMATQKKVQLFPPYQEDGNLFIGVEAQDLVGTLTLFFELDEDAAYLAVSDKPVIHWSCLTGNGWLLLEKNRVLSDSTEGFLMSGVVTLNLPQGMITETTLMPSGKYWLRVSCNNNLEGFCGLRSVQTNVAQLTQEEDNRGIDKPIEKDGWRAIKTVPGLAAVNQVGDVSGGRSAESESDFRTRVSERLRHKGRASSAWDYERLILAHFPEIFKVKCFPNTTCDAEGPRPGNVLIVVVPHMTRDARSSCEKGVVNRAVLGRIRKYVRALSSAFVRIDVRSPVYERIQVRCSVKFVGDISASGLYINRLNQAISDYICPWCDVGYSARFGWAIRADDIESYIRELEYVTFVTNFSILHVAEECNETFVLGDSAKLDSRHKALIKPRYPWSLAIPMSEHFIETTATVEPIKAQLTGVNELEIGTTFIIGGN